RDLDPALPHNLCPVGQRDGDHRTANGAGKPVELMRQLRALRVLRCSSAAPSTSRQAGNTLKGDISWGVDSAGWSDASAGKPAYLGRHRRPPRPRSGRSDREAPRQHPRTIEPSWADLSTGSKG